MPPIGSDFAIAKRLLFLIKLFFPKKSLKEVIRPQVPLRTPCYNLARLAKLRIVAIV